VRIMDKSAIYTRHNKLPGAHPTGLPQKVHSNDNFPEVVQPSLPEVVPYDDKSLGHYESQSQGQPKWWRRHWIWLLIAVLVVAIAIGGGVGGGLVRDFSSLKLSLLHVELGCKMHPSSVVCRSSVSD
jgi:hypothetical protein